MPSCSDLPWILYEVRRAATVPAFFDLISTRAVRMDNLILRNGRHSLRLRDPHGSEGG
jgi:hypothetical protein